MIYQCVYQITGDSWTLSSAPERAPDAQLYSLRLAASPDSKIRRDAFILKTPKVVTTEVHQTSKSHPTGLLRLPLKLWVNGQGPSRNSPTLASSLTRDVSAKSEHFIK